VDSYFDDPDAAAAFKKEALSWIGTPFRQYYQQNLEAHVDVKGPTGGIDCIGLVQEIFLRSGASEAFVFARDPADYQSHQLGEKVLDYFRGKIEDPQSKRLAEILVELEIPKDVTDPNAVTPRDFFKVGDVLILKHGSLFHMPVIIDDDLTIVNALPRLGVTEGTIQDSTFSKHLVAAFRMKPKSILRSSEGAE
jgi:hypothetical protein